MSIVIASSEFDSRKLSIGKFAFVLLSPKATPSSPTNEASQPLRNKRRRSPPALLDNGSTVGSNDDNDKTCKRACTTDSNNSSDITQPFFKHTTTNANADGSHDTNASSLSLPLTHRSSSPTELSSITTDNASSAVSADGCSSCHASGFQHCSCTLLSLPLPLSMTTGNSHPAGNVSPPRATSPPQPSPSACMLNRPVSPSSPSSPQSVSSPISTSTSSSSSSSPRSPLTFNFSSPPCAPSSVSPLLNGLVHHDLLQLPLATLPYQPVASSTSCTSAAPTSASATAAGERPVSPPSSPELLSLPTNGRISPINGTSANGMISLTSPLAASSAAGVGGNMFAMNPLAALASMTLANGMNMSLPLGSSMSLEYLQAAHAQQQALLWASIMCPTPLLPMNMAVPQSSWSLPFGNIGSGVATGTGVTPQL